MTQLEQLERRIEAMLFASGEPLDGERIAEILEIEEETVHQLVLQIRDRYQDQQSPLTISFLGGAYQISTLPEYSMDIQTALEVRRGRPLSPAALEVLAVIAYNQPVTRAFVEEVRGVDCSTLIRSLVEKDLIQEAGRMNIPGTPIIYKTTATFLRSFGLENLEQLPTLPSTDETPRTEIEGQVDLFEPTEN